MGKRELLIVLAFIVAGAVAYQIAAPPTQPGEGFSFSKLWSNARRQVQSDRATAEWQTTERQSVAASVREVRIRDINGAVVITGEDREDIAVELVVRSTGPDVNTAQDVAKRTKLVVDALEDAITFSAKFPPENRQTARLTLHVPKRLTATVTGSGGLTVSDIGGLRVLGVGTSTVTHIAGTVSGNFGSGTVDVSDAGALDLATAGSRATFTHIRGAVRLDVRSGTCRLVDAMGPGDVTSRLTDITIDGNLASIHLSGARGSVTITHPRSEVRVDYQQARVAAQLDATVPLSLSTTDADVTLTLTGPDAPGGGAAVDLDAVASDGDVLASEWSLTAEKHDRDSSLQHRFGAGARVSVRTTNGNIVIKKNSGATTSGVK